MRLPQINSPPLCCSLLTKFPSVPKYKRYEKRHKNLAAHCSPAFRVEVGDTVTVGTLHLDHSVKRGNIVADMPF